MKKNFFSLFFALFLVMSFFILGARIIFAQACIPHAYRLCVGNMVYWFNSCEYQEDLYQICQENQICSYGQCINSLAPSYNPYYTIACYKNNLYWYDSQGIPSGLFKSCVDNNSCTLDYCSLNKCFNILKCDGSTCPLNSNDYNTHCTKNQCGNGICQENLGENFNNCPQDCKAKEESNVQEFVSLSFWAKTENETEWKRVIEIGPNAPIYFKVILKNNGNVILNNASISFNIPSQIAFLGNLKIDEVSQGININEGINFGNLNPGVEKIITFEGQTGEIKEPLQTKASVFLMRNKEEQLKLDSLDINFQPGKVAGAAVESDESSFFNLKEIFEKKGLWVLGGIAGIFLFIVVFRKLMTKPY